jgi:hypothetical protein
LSGIDRVLLETCHEEVENHIPNMMCILALSESGGVNPKSIIPGKICEGKG